MTSEPDGGSFFLVHRGEDGQPDVLEPLDPDQVTVLRYPDGTVRGYEVSKPLGIETDDDGNVFLSE